MSQAQFTIPLIQPVPGQLITAQLWINEFLNLQTNLNPSGIGGYSDNDPQMQIQTAPYPGSVTSHASSTAGEIERLRYQLAQILGTSYWYQPPAVSIATAQNSLVPIGAVIDFPSATPPNANFLLANGQAIGRVAYATLFTLIGTTFGTGDGVNTFNIPNYTDRLPITAGNLYSLAATGGALAELTDPGHNHTQNAHSHTDSGHTHSTPNHQHELDYGTISAQSGSPISTVHATKDSDGNDTGNWFSAVGTNLSNIVWRLYKSATQNSGSGTSGSGNANIQNTTPTNNSNTTGITLNTTLPPYLAMYKLIRVL